MLDILMYYRPPPLLKSQEATQSFLASYDSDCTDMS